MLWNHGCGRGSASAQPQERRLLAARLRRCLGRIARDTGEHYWPDHRSTGEPRCYELLLFRKRTNDVLRAYRQGLVLWLGGVVDQFRVRLPLTSGGAASGRSDVET